MAIEESMDSLTAEVAKMNANFDRFFAAGGVVPAGGKPAGGKPPGRPAAVKITLDQVKAVAEKVKEMKGAEVAVALIVKHGAKKLVGLDPSKYAAFMAACEVTLNEEEPEEGEGDDAL